MHNDLLLRDEVRMKQALGMQKHPSRTATHPPLSLFTSRSACQLLSILQVEWSLLEFVGEHTDQNGPTTILRQYHTTKHVPSNSGKQYGWPNRLPHLISRLGNRRRSIGIFFRNADSGALSRLYKGRFRNRYGERCNRYRQPKGFVSDALWSVQVTALCAFALIDSGIRSFCATPRRSRWPSFTF